MSDSFSDDPNIKAEIRLKVSSLYLKSPCERFTYSIFRREVDGISIQILQEGAVYQIGELMYLYGLFIGLVQQCSEMLTPIRTNT